MCLAQEPNKAVMVVRLEPATPRSQVKHSTTEPLLSLTNRLENNVDLKYQQSGKQCGLHVPTYWKTMWIVCINRVENNVDCMYKYSEEQCRLHVPTEWKTMWIACINRLENNVDCMYQYN